MILFTMDTRMFLIRYAEAWRQLFMQATKADRQATTELYILLYIYAYVCVTLSVEAGRHGTHACNTHEYASRYT